MTSELGLAKSENESHREAISLLEIRIEELVRETDRMGYLLQAKAVELEKLTRDYEQECREIEVRCMAEHETQREGLCQEFTSKILKLEQEKVTLECNHNKAVAAHDVEASEFRGQLEALECELARSREGELALNEKILNLEQEVQSLTSALESKTKQIDIFMLKSVEELQKLEESSALDLKNLEEAKKKEVEGMRATFSSKVNLLEEDIRQKSLEIEQLAAAAENLSEEEFAVRCQEIRDSCLKESEQKCEEVRRLCKKEEEDALHEQKARYNVRVKEITEDCRKQYKAKTEECVTKWKSDIATKNGLIDELKKKLESSEKAKNEQENELKIFKSKYELAKQKVSEIVKQNGSKENALTQDRDQLVTKYAAAERVIATLETQAS